MNAIKRMPGIALPVAGCSGLYAGMAVAQDTTGAAEEQFRPPGAAAGAAAAAAGASGSLPPRSSPPTATGNSMRTSPRPNAPATAQKQCGMVQTRAAKKTPRSGLTLVLVKGQQSGKEVTMMRVMAPIGVYLPTGVALEVDGGAVGRVPFTRCLPQVCKPSPRPRARRSTKCERAVPPTSSSMRRRASACR